MKLLTFLLSLLIANPGSLIPKPVEVTPAKGVYVAESMNPDVKICRVKQMEHPGEYELKITPKGVVITAADDEGVFYAQQSLKQLLMMGNEISCATIRDYPRFEHRAFMLDVSRTFYPVDFIKRQLDAMALMKMNVFHFHLVDNNGWRIQIDKWPELTRKTAWRIGRDKDEWMENGCKFVPEGTPGAVGGYYTKEDIKEIVRYATELNIDVIPEIDVPSHSFSMLCAYPELSCENWKAPDYAPVVKVLGEPSPYHCDLCLGNPAVYDFVFSIFDEVAELFPSKYFHIGGDEACGREWASCPKCQALMQKEGVTNFTDFQNLFTVKAVAHLRKLGKTAVAWDEVICKDLPKDVIVTQWRDNALEAEGYQVVKAHEYKTYLCNNQDYIGKEPKAIKIHTPLNAVYDYEPGETGVRGVEACLWSERCPTEEIAEHQIYPRLAAIAERAWSPKDTRNYENFRERIINMHNIWDKMGIRYFDIRTEMYPMHLVPDGIKVNYKESLSHRGGLPDILTATDGSKVTAENWPERRQEILKIFEEGMYGQIPAKPEEMSYEIIEEGTTLAGFGLRRQVRMWFTADKTGPSVDWLIVLPKKATGPVPAVMLLNYFGNHTLLSDPEILLTPYKIGSLNSLIGATGDYASEETRGFFSEPTWRSTYPIATLLARGHAIVTAAYQDFFPDEPAAADREHKALATWGWSLMRGMDMLETMPEIDTKRVVLTGSSRLGKAALIAGAYDERFPVVVLNQTGGGGVPLAKHFYGENIASEMAQFPHWYIKEYGKYANNEAELPFDQHMILSCIAPRALLVQGFDDPWFDAKGEFMAMTAAQTVWEMLGMGGLGSQKMPADYSTSAIGEYIGYVRRDLDHGIAPIDWEWMLDFAEKQWER